MLASILCLIPSIIAYVVGEYYSKLWANKPSIHGFVPVVVCYAVSGALWLPALAYKNHLVIMSILWTVLAAIATTILGVYMFNEPLSGKQFVGLALAALVVYLLS